MILLLHPAIHYVILPVMPKSTRANATTAVATAVSTAVSTTCNPQPHIARSSATTPVNRRGSEPRGAYPEVSRTLLAAATGKHKSTVSNILRGKQRPTLAVALVMAEAMRVPITELDERLARQRAEYKGERGEKRNR